LRSCSYLPGIHHGPITAWLPLFLFVILFGLSMDYHVATATGTILCCLDWLRPSARSEGVRVHTRIAKEGRRVGESIGTSRLPARSIAATGSAA
jgi:hypothetical protein